MKHALFILLLTLALGIPAVSDAGRCFDTTCGTATTDIITTPAIASSSTNRSFCLWFNASAYDATVARRLLNHQSGGTLTMDLRVDVAGNLSYIGGYAVTDGSWNAPEPSTGSWHHVCVTHVATSSVNEPLIYIDGVSQTVTENTNPGGAVDSATQTYLIGNTVAANRVFTGKIAEVAIWSTILSGANVTSLYNSGSGARADTIGTPTAYYTLCGNASPEPDEMGGTAATVTGALATDHPFSNCGAAATRRSLMLLGVGS